MRMSMLPPELDVGAAAGHVGGDGHRPGHARVGHDQGFLFVVAGVQDVVDDARLGEQLGKLFRLLDRDGADQDRLTALITVADLRQDRLVLLAGRCARPRRRRRSGRPAVVGISVTSIL
jgi:hypothetical protein